jgi:hypothetical protein
MIDQIIQVETEAIKESAGLGIEHIQKLRSLAFDMSAKSNKMTIEDIQRINDLVFGIEPVFDKRKMIDQIIQVETDTKKEGTE